MLTETNAASSSLPNLKLTVVVTPPGGGKKITRAGHTLSILKKANGKWLLARDANLLSVISDNP